MRVGSGLLAFVLLLGFGSGAAMPARAQSAPPGCAGGAIVRTTTRVLIGPSIAADPLLSAIGYAANGVVAFFPDTVHITETTNYQGVDGLTRIEVHSFIHGIRTVLQIPAWLLDAYGGDITRIEADLEQGFLVDRVPRA